MLAAGLLVRCSHAPSPRPSSGATLPRPSGGPPDRPPTAAPTPGSAYLGEQMLCVDRELARRRLNAYGDPVGTNYANGSPLPNEVTGTARDRYDYVVRRHPEVGVRCSRAPVEPER